MAGDSLMPYGLAVAAAALALCTDWFLTSLAIPLFPMLGASPMATGVLFASKALVQIGVAPCVGSLVDRWGLAALAVGLLWEAATVVVFLVSFGYAPWLAARSLQGVASCLMASSAFGHLAKVLDGQDELLGRAMSMTITGLIVGATLGPPLGGMLTALGHSVPYLVSLALVSVTLVLTLAEWRNRRATPAECSLLPEDPGATAEAAGMQPSVLQLLADPLVFVALAVEFVFDAVVSSYESGFGIYAREAFGYGPWHVGLFFGIVCGTSALSSCLAGLPCVQRLGRWRVVGAGLVAMACGCIMGPKNSQRILGTSMGLLGLGAGPIAATVPALLGAASESHGNTAVVYSLQNAAEQLGFLLGPVLGNGALTLAGFWWSSAAAGALLLASLPLVYWVSARGGQGLATVEITDGTRPQDAAAGTASELAEGWVAATGA